MIVDERSFDDRDSNEDKPLRFINVKNYRIPPLSHRRRQNARWRSREVNLNLSGLHLLLSRDRKRQKMTRSEQSAAKINEMGQSSC